MVEENDEENKTGTKKDIKIVSGDGSDLHISPAYDHLNIIKPKSSEKKPKNIIIPEEKKKD